MKRTSVMIIVAMLFTTMMVLSNVNNACAVEEENGDPYRLIDTDLEYAIPNGTYCMWNNSESIYASGIINNGTGTEIHDHELLGSYWDYSTDRFTSHKVDDNTTEIVVKRYYNTTDNPACPSDIDEWSYTHNNTALVNRTLVGIIGGQNYYPDDVYVDDIFTNDPSFFKALMINMQFAPLIDFIWEAIDNVTASGNITLYDTSNSSTATIKNKYEGSYLYNFSTDVYINNIMGLTGMAINLTLLFDIDAKMNCYHVIENNLMNLTFQIQLLNTTNPLQNITLEISLLMENDLLCSTLVPCAWGYEFFGAGGDFFGVNWWWILIAIGGTFILTLGIMFAIQRSNCKNAEKPLENWACRVGSKYKKPLER